MKILHILDHSLPLHSGYTFRSQSIFRAQQKMGYEPAEKNGVPYFSKLGTRILKLAK